MTQNLFDPFSFWKSMYEKTESNLSEAIHEATQKEEFAAWMGNVQSGFLQYQKMIQSTTDAYLKQSNLPTRDEISNIASLIINLENKVENLDEMIDDKLTTNQVETEISNLKASISGLENKIDQLLKIQEYEYDAKGV